MMPSLIHWLTLAHTPGIGPASGVRLLEYFADIEALFAAAPAELHAAGLTSTQISLLRATPRPDIDKIYHWLSQGGRNTALSNAPACQWLTYLDPRYPALLKEIASPPLLLYLYGNLHALSAAQLAMVGSRRASATGVAIAQQFSRDLAQAGLVITSGLAYGIDAASHRGAIACGQPGKTIAILGTGLANIYPRIHTALANEILAAGGTLVSEFSPFTAPIAANFPQRNRIISGLSRGVLVVEAAARSGSLITARYALEQNRDVFAIPGSLYNPLARGCHHLLRQGAKLVETVNDILDEMGILAYTAPVTRVSGRPSLTSAQQAVLATLGDTPTSADLIINRCGLTAAEVSSILLLLELLGYVDAVPGGYQRRPS